MDKNSSGWLRMRSKDKESTFSDDNGKLDSVFYKEILDLIPDMVLRVNEDLKVIWANQAVLQVRSDVTGKPCYELFHQLDEPCENCPCKRCIETGEIEKGVVALPDRNGEGVRYWENTGIPVKDHRGKVISAIEISRDVTDRVNAINELQNMSFGMDNKINQYKDEAQKRFEFIHKLSLDIKNDIEDMSDQLSYIHHQTENKNIDWLDSMVLLNEKTLRRVGNLSDLFTMEETSIQLVYVPFEISELVDEIYNRFKQRAREKNVSLEVHLSRTVPKKLLGDIFRMNAILTNILENSLEHTINGSIKIYFNANGRSHDGFVQMQIIVADTGMGLTEERLERIQNLLKAEEDKDILDQAIELQGLGLLMAHSTLKVMGGHLEIDSQFGRGTQVRLYFKMGSKSEKGESKPREMIHEEEAEFSNRVKAERKKILIAEDEVVGRVTFKIHLQEHYDIVFAKNGKEAVELYLTEKPDLVFMDIMMPVMNGLEAFDEIEKKRRKTIPIIACTAKVIDSEKEYLLTYGFNDYLPKPIDSGNLLRMVAKYLK